jgi:agmatinase
MTDMKSMFGFENVSNINRLCDVVLIPYEKTTSLGKGTERGPYSIVSSSADVEEYDEETEIEILPSDLYLQEIAVYNNLPSKDNLEIISRYCKENVNRFSLFIGGEHSLTLSTFSSLCNKDTTLLILDAHTDVADKIDGERFSHGTWLRRLLEDGVKAISFGSRSMSKKEADFIKESSNFELWSMQKIREGRFSSMIEVLSELSGDIYLSIDMDSLESSLVPSIGSPQPGGFGWYEYCQILRTLFSNRRLHIRHVDIVEYVPNRHFPNLDIVAAKAACKVLFWKKWRILNE